MSAQAVAAGVVLALLVAGPVRAADRGVNIAWDACGPTGTTSKSFECSTNEGQAVLHVSFMLSDLDASQGPFYAYQASIGFYTPVSPWPPLPDWWRFGSGECREGMLACVFAPDAGTACAPMPSFPDTSWMLYYSEHGSLSVYPQGIIHAGGEWIALTAGVEYSLLRLTIKHSRSTGPDSCAGCSEPIAIGVYSVDLYTDTGGFHLETPLRQQYVQWSGSLVPVRRASWGQIKGLYR